MTRPLDLEGFKHLPLPRQVDLILHRPPKDRIRLVFQSEHPKTLVESLPELDLFLTVKTLEDRDAVDLVSLTTAEQFQYILDLDLWKKDQLDPEKTYHWIGILLECGEERVLRFIRETDRETIVQMLKKLLFVTKIEGDLTEQVDRAILFTLDQEYWVAFKKPETRPVLQRFLEYLYLADPVQYPMILESLISEIESELEEVAYRLRKGRMADHGFPDFEEALEIYRFVNPDTLKPSRGEKSAVPPQEGSRSPFQLDPGLWRRRGPSFPRSFLRWKTLPNEPDWASRSPRSTTSRSSQIRSMSSAWTR